MGHHISLFPRPNHITIGTMKLPILILLIVSAIAWAAPQALPTSRIEKGTLQPVYNKAEDVMLDDEGNFSVRFMSEDGMTVKEEGILVEDESTGVFTVIVQKGYYSYINDDGVPIELVYDARNPGEVVIDQ